MLLLICLINIFFIGPNHSYSILIPKNMELVAVDTLTESSVNYIFIGEDTIDSFEYSFSISIIDYKNDMKLKNSIQEYETECSCKVLDTEYVRLNYFKGFRYFIEKEKEGTHLYGVVYFSEEINGKLINIASMTTSSNSRKISEISESILKTMVINHESDIFTD